MKNLEEKLLIRKQLIEKRNLLPPDIRKDYSKLIQEKLFRMEAFKEAEDILIYASYQSEVETHNILKTLLLSGKRVFCPKVLEPKRMEFYQIKSYFDIMPGFKGIPEPLITHKVYRPNPNFKTIMVMPLVGFDDKKHRLGYGGGFYDCYLEKHPHFNTIALAFECQKTKEPLPTQDNDINPQWIITENNIY